MLERQIKVSLIEAFDSLYNHELKEGDFNLQPTRKEFEGQYTFVTFPFGRISKKSPEETGKELGAFLKDHSESVSDFNVVKGFLNISYSLLKNILKASIFQ